jgi:hypothetical protein
MTKLVYATMFALAVLIAGCGGGDDYDDVQEHAAGFKSIGEKARRP